jgi:hypothetical protein
MKIIRNELIQLSILMSLLLAGMYQGMAAEQINELLPIQPKPMLVFEKKPCFGFCPVYKATFLENGTVDVIYRQPGKAEAHKTFQLSKTEVKTLWQRGKNLGFFSLPEKFETQRTDFPVRELTMFEKGKSKKISYTEGGSAELETLMLDLAQIIEANLQVNFGPPKE